ncbi:uncharacterized protein HD556DRAFT_1385498 [Suillus plorans]|uniref:Secreted protein n=1 Tax=Suillus plorans TaxID=116603 RepID=A0A9P7AJB8_9AGAM|nr:uncharacterized protein HD556DRAFT_1389726 [Suillus plorans]XP_041158380.1 uncharacterized protein HD556DRAFT_1385498 [Suillus plorans]KAG1790645.1 hypothetical protein HD556DRAFT_1389726 [Suillus plorans]KAG1791574.1 hypothetical protein HD556DRAFT_1385498 [Suillus plorans]
MLLVCILRSVKCCLTASSLGLTLPSSIHSLYPAPPCQAPTMACQKPPSFRLRQAPLTPRQVLPNIFAISVLISTSTLYAASRPTTVPRQP